ncbi:MAG: T9SS type A sorting domain-containing protein [Candidatus Eisenbacteria bacterium]|uniref:T9SS type A sorting domain-containing protein n=1 Tax=Eiseniibacteriota bacterium TaxID=2212470 RepID=A0A538TJD1_UNCEI|nr:MAG: T9SS type A sorting domain-containing protein [Candidatus Eisenbacteria bacterium]
MFRPNSVSASRRFASALLLTALVALVVASPALAGGKTDRRDMYDVFSVGPRPSQTPAVSETTIKHKAYFTDLEGSNAGWGSIDYRLGQPNAWHRVTGIESCVGNAWWCGVTGLTYGDGYDNNWVQTLKTATPINLASSSGNVLTFKHRCMTEDGYDFAWVLIHDGSTASTWDTLAQYSGFLGTSCINASLPIPDTWTTRQQPIQLMFLFGSDFSYSRADSNNTFTGWSIDDVKITATGGAVKFFDDMEAGGSNWVASSPDPGPMWHIENSPGTSVPASCFFLSTNVWVPFQGFGFGQVPDFVDAMLTSPPVDITGIFVGANTSLRLQFDNWINLPSENNVVWSLWIQGSNDGATWTPWHNALYPITFTGTVAQCVEGSYIEFNPYNTPRTGVQPGTRFVRLGFRIRDEKPTDIDASILRLGNRTEGIYFDNIGVYSIYTITGVEPVDGVPVSTRASIQRVYPNPFNPATTIEFSVPKAGATTVRIFDLQGKALATLANSSMSAGVYRVRWNGKTEDGRDLSSGVYFVSVENAGSHSRGSARIIMMK